jgi:hypothetical protein
MVIKTRRLHIVRLLGKGTGGKLKICKSGPDLNGSGDVSAIRMP